MGFFGFFGLMLMVIRSKMFVGDVCYRNAMKKLGRFVQRGMYWVKIRQTWNNWTNLENCNPFSQGSTKATHFFGHHYIIFFKFSCKICFLTGIFFSLHLAPSSIARGVPDKKKRKRDKQTHKRTKKITNGQSKKKRKKNQQKETKKKKKSGECVVRILIVFMLNAIGLSRWIRGAEETNSTTLRII